MRAHLFFVQAVARSMRRNRKRRRRKSGDGTTLRLPCRRSHESQTRPQLASYTRDACFTWLGASVQRRRFARRLLLAPKSAPRRLLRAFGWKEAPEVALDQSLGGLGVLVDRRFHRDIRPGLGRCAASNGSLLSRCRRRRCAGCRCRCAGCRCRCVGCRCRWAGCRCRCARCRCSWAGCRRQRARGRRRRCSRCGRRCNRRRGYGSSGTWLRGCRGCRRDCGRGRCRSRAGCSRRGGRCRGRRCAARRVVAERKQTGDVGATWQDLRPIRVIARGNERANGNAGQRPARASSSLAHARAVAGSTDGAGGIAPCIVVDACTGQRRFRRQRIAPVAPQRVGSR